VTPKQLLHLVFVALAALVTVPAIGAPNKDAATLKKIDEAVNVHYIAAEFNKAESLLINAIKACGTKACSGEVIAKAYVYVGIIRGNGKNDLAGARQAFENAQAADPNVTLDATLVTPAVLAEFNKVMGKEGESSTAKPETAEAVAAPVGNEGEAEVTLESDASEEAPQGGLQCKPATGLEVQTARPIPIQCERMEGVVRGELHYKAVGAEEYTAMLMKFNSSNATLQAAVPCDALPKKGTLSVYVIAQNENKEMVATFGTAEAPIQYTIVDKTKEAPPRYPGEPAPGRCKDVLEEAKGGAGPGQACTMDHLCRKDHYCNEGICQKTPTCDTNEDCESDHCVDGLCKMKQVFEAKAKVSRWMVGINIAQDLWISSSAKNVCGGTNASNGDFNCYNAGSSRINVSSDPAVTNNIPMADTSGNVKTTLVPATTRILASLDYALSPAMTIGTRLGMALNGGPPTIHYDNGRPSQNKDFFLAHLELRGSYWFTPLDQPGIHPYLGLSLGLAEVDAKVPVTAWYVPAAGATCTGKQGNFCPRKLDAWRKMGKSFAGLNFGWLLKAGGHHNFVLNVNLNYMLPSSGIVLEPSLGYLFGF